MLFKCVSNLKQVTFRYISSFLTQTLHKNMLLSIKNELYRFYKINLLKNLAKKKLRSDFKSKTR